jgi:hypothetical protein
MDETLNRPLFRHKAQIAFKKVQGLQFGGPPQSPFTPGGFGQSMQRLGQAYQASPLVDLIYDPKQGVGRNIVNVFNPMRKARGIYGLGKMGVGLAGRGLEKVERGYEKLASKSPKGFGAATQVAGLGLGAGGVEDIIEGVRTDDLSKTASGAGDILLGIPLARSGGARFRTGKPTDQTLLEGLPALGFYGASMVLPENELKKTQDLQIQQYEKQTGVKLNANQRKEAESIIAKQYEAQQQGQQPKTALDLAFPGLSNVDIIEGKGRQDPVNLFSDVSRNIVQQSNDAKGIPPTGLSKEEYVATIDNDERKRKSGEDIIKKAKTDAKKGDAAASRFQKFYEEYDKQIGGSREISDLIMYKLATGLLTGTTTKSGFAGFADVLGKAGGDVLDTAILLASKEKDRKASLFEAFYKAEKADKSDAITTDRFTTLIPDPNAFNGVRVEERAKFKTTGLDAKAVASNEIDPTTGIRLPVWIEAEYNPNAIETKKDPKLLDERRAALNSVASSYKMADAIAKQDPGTLGAPGSIKLFKEKLIGSISGILENEITPSQYNKDVDSFVNNEILGQGVRKADGTFISAKDAIAEKEKLINDLVKEKTKSKFFQRPSANELEKLVRNVRYETNFAYAYANSLKAEDRLTEKNLEDAKKVSKIFGLESPTKIIEQFKQLADDANTKFGEETKRYQALGGNSAFFDQNFTFMPYYQKEKNRIGGLQRRQEIQQNLMKGVETLPDKYK